VLVLVAMVLPPRRWRHEPILGVALRNGILVIKLAGARS
jgi:hypothetical protein